MNKKVIITKFEELTRMAERFNSHNGSKRFYPINSRDGKIPVFGMYDYKTKRYILSKPFVDVEMVFDEIRDMIKTA